jgi:hypothetical protein
MLVSSSYVPNQAVDQFASTPAAFEITGTGYTAGGMALSDVTVADSGTTLTLSAANTSWPGATFTAAGAVVYDAQSGSNTTNPLIGFINFGGEMSPDDVPFTIAWASGVVLQISTPTAVLAFDAVGSGGSANDASTMSGTHAATSGAQMLAYVSVFGSNTVSSITYGGTAMTLLGSVDLDNNSNDGILYLFGLSDAPSGSKTVDVTLSAATEATFCTVSYVGVGSVGTPATTFGAGTSLSQSLTCWSGQVISQAFGTGSTLSASFGGTERFLDNVASLIGLVIQDSPSSATFTATSGSFGDEWAGIGVVLS